MSCTKDKKNDIVTDTTNSGDSISASNTNPTDTGKITYLALGDSYTIGETVAESDRFPVQLVTLLQNDSVKIDHPDIVAVTGWTTGNLLNALTSQPPKTDYSFVTLLIGVNNQYQGRSLEEYKTQFSQLLSLAISYARSNKDHVFVLSIPDYSVTPFAAKLDKAQIAQQIDEFNEANHLISQNARVNYLDITPISRDAANDPSLIARDGLHPSSQQYLKWDQLLEPLVLKAIRK
ncbi:MAG: SGNH/GDSL hydrolase family protein [Ginsengibacter sp.]